MQEVLPPYSSVVGPGVGIEPRTPQNLIRTGVARGALDTPEVCEEDISRRMRLSGQMWMFPRFAISPLKQVQCRGSYQLLPELCSEGNAGA